MTLPTWDNLKNQQPSGGMENKFEQELEKWTALIGWSRDAEEANKHILQAHQASLLQAKRDLLGLIKTYAIPIGDGEYVNVKNVDAEVSDIIPLKVEKGTPDERE